MKKLMIVAAVLAVSACDSKDDVPTTDTVIIENTGGGSQGCPPKDGNVKQPDQPIGDQIPEC